MNSTLYPECDNCKHQHRNEGVFCYMFDKKPRDLPCGQHDKFRELRKATGKAILRNPLILMAMVNELNMDLKGKL